MSVRILVVDDHEVVRSGLRALLQQQSEWVVCGEAGDGREAVAKAQLLDPDIVIMDVAMPLLNGLEATRQLLKLNPSRRILILTLYDSNQIVRDVLSAGARGFLLKSDAGRDLIAAIEALVEDKTYFTSAVASMVLDSYVKTGIEENVVSPRASLTPREREIVQLLAEGKTTKEAAVALGLSVKTAETHRSNIMRKLGIHSVPDLVLYAVRNNIVHLAPPPAS